VDDGRAPGAVDTEAIDWFYTQVGGHIRRTRAGAGLTQLNLADRIGLTRSSVANIEGGRQRIPLHTLVAIASVLNAPLGDLLPDGGSAAEPGVWGPVEHLLAGAPESTREFVRTTLARLDLQEVDRG
jgi:transcriptional regulator with XRE-family HTH domain